jgi:hypothetical protein
MRWAVGGKQPRSNMHLLKTDPDGEDVRTDLTLLDNDDCSNGT